MNKKRIIAVTGGIGSGKSTVLNQLSKLGYPVFSCDEILNEVYSDKAVKEELKKMFPTAIIGNLRLSVDRKTLSNLCFSSPENRKKLEAITHPYILKKAINKIKRCGAKLSFLEVPLLFEGGYQELFDGVLVVKRNLKDRIESVKTRSNLSEQEILARISAQVDYDSLDLSNCVVIVNDKTQEELKEKTLEAVKKLL